MRGVTDTTITVGGLGTSGLYGDAAVGAKARFERANAAGGVNGRTITFQGITDDGGTPDTNKAAVEKIAGADVFAVVPAVASDMAGANDLVNVADAVLRLGAVVRASAATGSASGTRAASRRAGSPRTSGARR